MKPALFFPILPLAAMLCSMLVAYLHSLILPNEFRSAEFHEDPNWRSRTKHWAWLVMRFAPFVLVPVLCFWVLDLLPFDFHLLLGSTVTAAGLQALAFRMVLNTRMNNLLGRNWPWEHIGRTSGYDRFLFGIARRIGATPFEVGNMLESITIVAGIVYAIAQHVDTLP